MIITMIIIMIIVIMTIIFVIIFILLLITINLPPHFRSQGSRDPQGSRMADLM